MTNTEYLNSKVEGQNITHGGAAGIIIGVCLLPFSARARAAHANACARSCVCTLRGAGGAADAAWRRAVCICIIWAYIYAKRTANDVAEPTMEKAAAVAVESPAPIAEEEAAPAAAAEEAA